MPGKLNTNYLGNAIRGLGKKAAPIYKASRDYLDSTIATQMAARPMMMYGGLAAGAGAYMATRNSNSSLVRGAGTAAGLGTAIVGGRMAYNAYASGGMAPLRATIGYARRAMRL